MHKVVQNGYGVPVRCAAAIVLSAALVAGGALAPAAAFADTESDLAAARAQLESIGQRVTELDAQLESATETLTQTDYQISELETQVADKQAELDQAQQVLSDRLSPDYKGGGSGLLQVLMGASSFDEIVSQLFYVNKVTDAETEAIDTVARLKGELEAQQAELESTRSQQEQNVSSLQASVDELNSQRTAASDLVSSLDAQVQAELAAEAEQNATLQAAVEASQAGTVSGGTDDAQASQAADEAVSGSSGGSSTSGSSSGTSSGSSGSGGSSSGSSSGSGSSSSGSSGSSSSTPDYDASTGNAVVARAYSKLGTAYVYGACSPDAFDCSGFVSYCLTGSYTRLGTTYTFMNWPQVSDPQPGDVCTSSTHCGIYIGNGQMIHASRPGVGVVIGSVQSNMIFVRMP